MPFSAEPAFAATAALSAAADLSAAAALSAATALSAPALSVAVLSLSAVDVPAAARTVSEPRSWVSNIPCVPRQLYVPPAGQYTGATYWPTAPWDAPGNDSVLPDVSRA